MTIQTPATNADPFFVKPKLPPVRKMFVPDPGYAILDFDQDGAEARYVAWEDAGMFKQAFIDGIKIHIDTMKNFFPDKYAIDPKFEPWYTKCKNMCYGSCFGGRAKGISIAASIQQSTVERFQPWFFQKYPGITDWHARTETKLLTTREIRNWFGYRIHYFDRPGGLLPTALAWQSQSSIAIVTQRAHELIEREFPQIEWLNQVHDSLIFQIKFSELPILDRVRRRLCTAEQLAIPFPNDPLLIPWNCKISRKSWGDALPYNTETGKVQTSTGEEAFQ